jgi:hypothetical protein
MEKYNHIGINLILFIALFAMFAIPAYSFTIFKPVPTQNVLGEKSYSKNGVVFTEKQGIVTSFSVNLEPQSQINVPLNFNTISKQVYLQNAPETVYVVLENNNLVLFNLSNTNQSVKGIVY